MAKFGASTNLLTPDGHPRYKEEILAKYGVDNVLKLESTRAKARKTTRERFGVDYVFCSESPLKKAIEENRRLKIPEAVVKMRATSRERYGTDNPAQNPAIMSKILKTNRENNGGQHNFQTKENRELVAKALHKLKTKYFVFGNTPLKVACKERGAKYISAQQIIKRYGVEACERYLKNFTSSMSDIESCFLTGMKDVLPDISFFNQRQCRGIEYRPDFKLAHNGKTVYVCVHGLYWHSEKKKSPDYHMKLREAFEGKGLTLMQFYADEVIANMPIVRSMVMSKLGMLSEKIDARKCSIKEMSHKDGMAFIYSNHLMGAALGSRYLGLFHKGECVAVIGWRKKPEHIELTRFAVKRGAHVRGGFSRLLAKVPRPVISYCDLRYASGEGYLALGFQRESTTLGFEWTNAKVRYNRLHCAATDEMTEEEHSLKLKLYKLFDAGQVKFRLV